MVVSNIVRAHVGGASSNKPSSSELLDHNGSDRRTQPTSSNSSISKSDIHHHRDGGGSGHMFCDVVNPSCSSSGNFVLSPAARHLAADSDRRPLERGGGGNNHASAGSVGKKKPFTSHRIWLFVVALLAVIGVVVGMTTTARFLQQQEHQQHWQQLRNNHPGKDRASTVVAAVGVLNTSEQLRHSGGAVTKAPENRHAEDHHHTTMPPDRARPSKEPRGGGAYYDALVQHASNRYRLRGGYSAAVVGPHSGARMQHRFAEEHPAQHRRRDRSGNRDPFQPLGMETPPPPPTTTTAPPPSPPSPPPMPTSLCGGPLRIATESLVRVTFDVWEDEVMEFERNGDAPSGGGRFGRMPETVAADGRGQNAAQLYNAALLAVLNATSTPPSPPVSTTASSPYFSFFHHRRAEFHSIGSLRADASDEPSGVPHDDNMDDDVPLPASQRITIAPFQLDVVYTYVNPASPSHHAAVRSACEGRSDDDEHRSATFAVKKDCDGKRFRDWDELKFSLRSVYRRAMCPDPSARTTCGAFLPLQGQFVRNIFLVVADDDQVPARWMNLSTSRPTDGGGGEPWIRVVRHRDLFPSDVDSTGARVLPTLNSHAIESALHRIPGLSKYFVYFNNDMLWGRRVSLFDYFRPLSWERAHYRDVAYNNTLLMPAAAVPASEHDDAAVPPGPTEGGERPPRRPHHRVTMLFEPIHYFERVEDPFECMAERVHEPTVVSSSSGATTSTQRSARCRGEALPAAPNFFSLRCREGRRFDFWRHFSNFNKRLLFDRVVGGYPSHSFAHYPRLMDRQVLARMVDRDFADVVAETRRQRTRGYHTSFWTTFMYAYYAISARREIDGDLAVQRGEWARPDYLVEQQAPGGGDDNAAAHDTHQQQNDQRAVGVDRERKRGVNEALRALTLDGLAPLVDVRNGPLWPQYLQPLPPHQQLSLFHASVAERPGSRVDHNEGVNRRRHHNHHDDALLRSPTAAWHRLALEKSHHSVVEVDSKGPSGIYHFCLITDHYALANYHQELQDQMKLFVTVNDDLYRATPDLDHRLHSLLALIAGDASSSTTAAVVPSADNKTTIAWLPPWEWV